MDQEEWTSSMMVSITRMAQGCGLACAALQQQAAQQQQQAQWQQQQHSVTGLSAIGQAFNAMPVIAQFLNEALYDLACSPAWKAK